MTKEDLKALGVSDEVIEQIFKEFVAKSQFNAKNNELKSLKESVQKLEQEASGNKELKEAFEKLKAEASKNEEAYKQRLNDLTRDSAIELAIRGAKGRNSKAIKALLDLEKIKLNEGKVEGLDEQIKALQEENGWLFDTGAPNIEGAKPATPPASQDNAITKADFDKMSYSAQEELYRTNKELYEEFTKGD